MTETEVTVRFWAAARAATGMERDTFEPGPLERVLAAAVARYSALGPLLPRCSYLVDGTAVTRADAALVSLPAGAVLEVLPPFAGG